MVLISVMSLKQLSYLKIWWCKILNAQRANYKCHLLILLVFLAKTIMEILHPTKCYPSIMYFKQILHLFSDLFCVTNT